MYSSVFNKNVHSDANAAYDLDCCRKNDLQKFANSAMTN